MGRFMLIVLLFACVAFTLQSYNEGHHNASLSTRRLASKNIRRGSSLVLRGNPLFPNTLKPPSYITLHPIPNKCLSRETMLFVLNEPKTLIRLRNNWGLAEIYRVKVFAHPVVVKKVIIGEPMWRRYPQPLWTEEDVKKEIDNLHKVDQYFGRVADGNARFILMKDMGFHPSDVPGLPPDVSKLTDEADGRYQRYYAMKRRHPRSHRLSRVDYVYRRLDDGSFKAEPVGEWRNAESTGTEPERPVPTDRHYCEM